MDHLEEQGNLVSEYLVVEQISQILLHEQVLRFFFFVGCSVNTIFNNLLMPFHI